MDNATEILVIITSSVLVVFLLLAIAAVIQLMIVLGKIKRLAAKAEDVANAVESAADAFQNTVTPIRFGSLLGNFAKTFVKAKRRK